MNLAEQLKEEYLRRCADYCNHGGYSRLEFEREKIRREMVDKYGVNGNREEIFRKIMICEETVFSFLEELSKQKFRHYMWITDFYEKKLIGRLNTALQEA